jgi:Na+-transporting NADH:ubiquinone oxidoreductase subunit C
MNVNSNSYTYGFAIALVVIVAAALSIAATSLKPMQDANVALEKKADILSSVGLTSEDPTALYAEVISEQLVLVNGQVVDGASPDAVDMAAAIALPESERQAPLYVARTEGKTYYIIPVRGKGLWGPIWGYVSLNEDGTSVYGATFGHKSETPGLGAEITTEYFTGQFPGKVVYSDTYTGIEVRKGDASGNQQVDGISGGTITSVGVQYMLENCLKPYQAYLKSRGTVPTAAPVDSDTTVTVATL